MKIAIIGDAFVDISAGPLDHLPTWGTDSRCQRPIQILPGGSAVNTAVHLSTILRCADLAPTKLFTAIGKDELHKIILKHLEKIGVDMSITQIDDEPTGACIVLSGREDRAFVTHYGAARKFRLEHINKEELFQANHVHIAGFYSCSGLAEGLVELLQELKARGITTSLDTNYDSSGQWSGLNEILPLLDIFLPNDVEAKAISRKEDMDDVINYFQHLVPLTVITMGRMGAQAIAASSNERKPKIIKHKSIRVEAVDPTGAGDSFNAGFLYGWKVLGSIEEGLRYGTATAALCVQKPGACDFPRELIDIEQLLRTNHMEITSD